MWGQGPVLVGGQPTPSVPQHLPAPPGIFKVIGPGLLPQQLCHPRPARKALCAFLQSQPRPGKHPDASGSSQGALTHASLRLQTQTCSRGTRLQRNRAGLRCGGSPSRHSTGPPASTQDACTHVWGRSQSHSTAWELVPPCPVRLWAWGLGAGVLPPDRSLSWANWVDQQCRE